MKKKRIYFSGIKFDPIKKKNMTTEQITKPGIDTGCYATDSQEEPYRPSKYTFVSLRNTTQTDSLSAISALPQQTINKEKSDKEVTEKITTNEKVRKQLRQVTNDVRAEYEFFRSTAKEEDIQNGVLELLEKKLFEGTPARPFFVHSNYQYLKSQAGIVKHKFDKYFHAGISLIFEAIICVQYYDNHILDNKANVKTKEQVKVARRKAYRLKKILYEYIDKRFSETPGFSGWLKTGYINRIFLFVDLGQKIEIEFNHAHYLFDPKEKNVHLKNFIVEYLQNVFSSETKSLNEKEKLIRENIKIGFEEFNYGDTFSCKEQIGNEISRYVAAITELTVVKNLLDALQEDSWFLKLYFQRTSVTCGYLYYSAVKLAIDVLEIQGKLKDETLHFARYFGITRQLVNDNADLLPSYFNETTKAKVKKDAFSDLRNGNITLPIYLLWIYRKKKGFFSFLIRHSTVLLKSGVPKLLEEILLHAFSQSFTIFHSLFISKKLANCASKYLDSVNSFSPFLDYMTTGLAGTNKYYKHFYSLNTYSQYKTAKKKATLTSLEKELKFGSKKARELSLQESLKLLLPPCKQPEASLSQKANSRFEAQPSITLQSSWLQMARFFFHQCFHVQIGLKNLRHTPFIGKLGQIRVA
ncbi:MAG: polyprenyl synthetase family protein [Chlamydiia bacterium]|nr:polyprenyl synthetase family protein [Chlamydiia bacterium]